MRSGGISTQDTSSAMNNARATRSLWRRATIQTRPGVRISRRNLATETQPPPPPPPRKEPSRVVRHNPPFRSLAKPTNITITTSPFLPSLLCTNEAQIGCILRHLWLPNPQMLPRRPIHIPTRLLPLVQARNHRRTARNALGNC